MQTIEVHPFEADSARHPITPTGGPALQFDLRQETGQLCREPAWSGGRNAKTLVKHADFRMVLTMMKRGTRMHQHHAKGSVTIQPVLGHLRVHALEKTFDLQPGQILSLDPNLPHDVEALGEDSSFLVSIAWPGSSQSLHPANRGHDLIRSDLLPAQENSVSN